MTVRRRNPQQQVEAKIRQAAGLLLDVIKLSKVVTALPEESYQYLDAIGRRIQSIQERMAQVRATAQTKAESGEK